MNTYCGKAKDFIRGIKDVTKYQFDTYNIDPSFPTELSKLQEKDLKIEECLSRKDFRGERTFTIDCEDCKDMDDAVSVVKTAKGYRLAVHIADVSTYVPLGSELDQIASYRATSIYLPHLTVPMLPKALSNGCCSLNPGVSRYTLSVIAHINENGEVVRSEITKGKIRSRVKGVYSEVNKLLSGVSLNDELAIRVGKEVLRYLPEEKLKALSSVKREEMNDYLMENIPEIEEMVLRIRQEYLLEIKNKRRTILVEDNKH